MKIRVFMAAVLLLISHCVFSSTSLPHIVILATGGTIAGRQPIIHKPPDINLVNLVCKH